ncbi:tetratricopeptide repeat protein [Ensifer adhaerens]|uniref:tetratricopeptide repeat protein n=1 Tax=Ensifer adhaerens TaxID=106592 RepID=UPI003CFF8E58
MIRALWAKLQGMLARPAPPLREAAAASCLGSVASLPAGETLVSPRLFALAEAGDVEAQAALGEHFFDDREENFAACLHWNACAARAGHVGAQSRLATIYHEGLGVERHPETAFYWWYSAACQNHRGAKLMVAAAFDLGIGVEADLMEAAYWASLAYLAARDDPEGRELVDPYCRSVMRKLTEEQKSQALARLQLHVKQD